MTKSARSVTHSLSIGLVPALPGVGTVEWTANYSGICFTSECPSCHNTALRVTKSWSHSAGKHPYALYPHTHIYYSLTLSIHTHSYILANLVYPVYLCFLTVGNLKPQNMQTHKTFCLFCVTFIFSDIHQPDT